MFLIQRVRDVSQQKPSLATERKNRKAVFILREEPKTLFAHIDYVIETVFLQKVDIFGYYNSVSGNLRLGATLVVALYVSLSTLVLAGLIFLAFLKNGFEPVDLKLDVSNFCAAAFVFNGFWIGLFWQEKNRIYSKWEYLASLYNDVIRMPVTSRDVYSERDILRVALAMDILKLEMWAHSSFDSVFKEILADAIRSDMATDKATADALVGRLCTIGIKRDEADRHLLNYQSFILSVLRSTKAA